MVQKVRPNWVRDAVIVTVLVVTGTVCLTMAGVPFFQERKLVFNVTDVRAVVEPGKGSLDPAKDDYEAQTAAGEVYRRFRGDWFHAGLGTRVIDRTRRRALDQAVQRYLFSLEPPQGEWESLERRDK